MKKDSLKNHGCASTRLYNSAVKAGLVLLLVLSLSAVPVAASSVTISTETTSVFLGDTFTVSGINTESDYVTLYIRGVNFEETLLVSQPISVSADDSWRATIDSYGITNGNGRKMDVGTYTIMAVASDSSIPEDPYVFLRATVAIPFRQPFISIVEAPEVIAQDTAADFVVEAEASPNGIQWYIFGTNFFDYGAVSTPNNEDRPNKFTVKLSNETTKDMPAGQYFAVFQHPMYDRMFNIMANDTVFYLNTTGNAVDTSTTPATVNGFMLFNALDRQTANAAQALCDALDSQNIDDMYVKYSFFIVGTSDDEIGDDQSFSISEIPTEVLKGDKIVISGVDTANAGNYVTVEMLSTAFAAVPKETVGSAAFIVVSTEIAEDGTWEVTLDTSDLNVDEYSLSVAVNSKVRKSVHVNIIDPNEPTPTPDTPTPTPTPTPDDFIPQPETLTELLLQKGWNFVSVQKTLAASNNTAVNVFGGVNTAENAILGYNAETQHWEQITASTIIKPLSGYWIYANEPVTIPLYYSDVPVAPAVKSLYEGWNAVGLSSGSATTAKSAFAGIDWRTVLPWNLEKGVWDKPLVNGGSSVNSAEQYLKLGNGSWLYVDADGILVGLTA